MRPFVGVLLVVAAITTASPSIAAAPPADSNERWSDRFFLHAALPANAVAVVGSDVYVAGTDPREEPFVHGVHRWDGTEWSTLGGGVPQGSEVLALAVLGSDVYAAGTFIEIGGTSANRVARWDGGQWTPLGAGFDASVRALYVFGGELYAGGNFQNSGDVPVQGIAKWDGAEWSAVGGGVPASVGDFASIGSDLYVVSGSLVMRWNGLAWATLGSLDDGYALSIAVVGTDLYFGGIEPDFGAEWFSRVSRWDGDHWVPLGRPSEEPYTAIYHLESFDGMLHAAENIDSIFLQRSARLWKWDGEAWSFVDDSFDEFINALAAVGSDLYVAGDFLAAGTVAATVARWNGWTWTAVGSDGGRGAGAEVRVSALYKGQLYIGGYFETAGSVAARGLARWTGKDWAPVGGGVSGRVTALETDGEFLYVGGGFDRAGNVDARSIARWDGSSWSALGEGIEGWVNAIAIDGDDVYAAGNFSKAGGKPASSIARWNGEEWSPLGGGVSDHALALAVGPDGLYVGGEFYWAGDDATYDLSHIARWDGAEWHKVGDEWDGSIVYALAAHGGRIYAGGSSTQHSSSGVAEWNGKEWTAVPGTMHNQGIVTSILPVGEELYVAGSMELDAAEGGVAKWDGEGWTGFGSGHAGTAFTVEVLNGSLWTGGIFQHAGDKTAWNVSKYRFADPFEICGDFNGDEILTAGDALNVLRTAVGIADCELEVCDANQDAKITALDALSILRSAVGVPVAGLCGQS